MVNSKAEIDDIDHLSIGVLGQLRATVHTIWCWLARMARTIRERMNVRDNEVFTPIDLINAKTLSSVINTFWHKSTLPVYGSN